MTDEKELCKVTVTNNHELMLDPDLGSKRVETRYGIYNLTISLPDDLVFHPLTDRKNLNLDDEKNGNLIEEDASAFELPDPKRIWMHYLIVIGWWDFMNKWIH